MACAAVAIEGFAPPSETKHWPLKHDSLIEIETHESELGTIVRGLMKIMETELAVNAPHDVILLDGSITSQIIHMHQAITAARDPNLNTNTIGQILEQRYEHFLRSFQTILKGNDHRIWASLPKFTSRSELGKEYDSKNGWPQRQDDRAILTTILEPGEFTKPIEITDTAKDGWHLPKHSDPSADKIRQDDVDEMGNQMVFYYKPHDFTPALRVEVARAIATSKDRMAVLLKSLKYQYASYAIMEPYPLYMADRMVKNLSGAIPTLRQAALQKVAENSTLDLKGVIFSLRGYRTEGGR